MKKQLFFSAIVALMGAMITSCSESHKNHYDDHVQYLAVQTGVGENWSIIDANGKVVVDGEYAPDNTISMVTENGTYWVKQNNKYQLFSIKSPRKPLVSTEFDAVTDFFCGLAMVSILGEPIQIIDESGNIKATLPKDVVRAYPFSDDMAIVQNKDGNFGFVNTSGTLVVEMEYGGVNPFYEGKALVISPTEKMSTSVINKKGKEVFPINPHLYKRYDSFKDDMMAVTDENDRFEFLNEKGEVALRLKADQNPYFQFIDGYLVIHMHSGDFGVIDKKGESVIRAGKYKWIQNQGKGMFAVKKNDKWGVVDKDDNKLVDFDYDDILSIALGDKFIAKQGSAYLLVKNNGEEIKGIEFYAYCDQLYSSVTYVDVKSIVEGITGSISTSAYLPTKGMNYPSEFGKKFNLNPEDYKYTNALKLPSFQAGTCDVEVVAKFISYAAEMMTHTETVDDGWFAHEKIVEDGFGWNSVDHTCIELTAKIEDTAIDGAYDLLIKTFKAKGFSEESNDNKKQATLVAETQEGRMTIDIYKNSKDIFLRVWPAKQYDDDPGC